jgi:hypothetical protein
MKDFVWSLEKAAWLEKQVGREGITFDRCIEEIRADRLLDLLPNPSSNHPDQKMYVLNIDGYAVCVPFVESKSEIFLKTIFPSRKMTAKYLGENSNG